jgi:peptidyl-prolyl cis-trans isomerase SurA
MNKLLSILLFILTPYIGGLNAQEDRPQVADRIAAIVGDEIVLQSEVMKNISNLPGGDTLSVKKKKCRTLAKTLEKKLLLTKAKADSVEVKESRVNAELNRRIQYFVSQIGSREKLEEYYNRTIPEIRENFRQPVKELLRSQRMRQKLLKSVSVSPKEVKAYYQSLPSDSIPYFNTQVKMAHIVRKPKPTEKEKEKARQRLRDLRERIVKKGESFDNLAILYSDDEQSATDGGELDMQKKSNFNKQFASAATKLDIGDVSRVIQTPDGFHIIKLLDRKGDQIHVKHILKKPQITAKSRQHSREFLDSVRNLIRNDTFSFEQAAIKFSEDDKTRNNGGLLTNPKTGAHKLPAKQLNSEMFFNVDTMKEGDISKPLRMKTNPNSPKEAYRIIKLKEKIAPHRANLEQDYPRLKRMAVNKAKQDKMEQWYKKYARQTYLELKSDATDCKAIKPYLPSQ